MRVVAVAPFGVGQPDQPHQLHSAVARLTAVHADVRADSLADLVAHREQRIQRGARLLEHHRNVLAAQCRELLVGQAGDVAVADQHGARHAGGVGQQADRRAISSCNCRMPVRPSGSRRDASRVPASSIT